MITKIRPLLSEQSDQGLYSFTNVLVKFQFSPTKIKEVQRTYMCQGPVKIQVGMCAH